MSNCYIQLGNGENEADRINLCKEDVDLCNYDNNDGYNVYSIVVVDSKEGEVARFDFTSWDERDYFAGENGFILDNIQWFCDVDGFSITVEDSDRCYTIPCKCDVNAAFVRA